MGGPKIILIVYPPKIRLKHIFDLHFLHFSAKISPYWPPEGVCEKNEEVIKTPVSLFGKVPMEF